MSKEKENLLEKVIAPPETEENEDTTFEEKAKIIKEWLSDAHIHGKTELNQNQINAVTVLRTLAVEYDILPLLKLLNNFLKYMLSKGRKSSSELVEILKSQNEVEEDGLGHLAKFLE